MTSTLDRDGRVEQDVHDKHALHRPRDLENDVRQLRTAEGLSQGDLAHALAVSRQTVNAIETGRYTPSLPLAIAIARYFGSTVEEIFHADHS
jgi:putative transcriptional regulator